MPPCITPVTARVAKRQKNFKGWVWVHHIFFGWAVKISHHYFNLHLPNAKCASCRKSPLNRFFLAGTARRIDGA
jgi:hypothetical protein